MAHVAGKSVGSTSFASSRVTRVRVELSPYDLTEGRHL